MTTLKDEIMQRFTESADGDPAYGITANELFFRVNCGGSPLRLWKAMNELGEEGKIKPTPERRKLGEGESQAVWVLFESKIAVPEPRQRATRAHRNICCPDCGAKTQDADGGGYRCPACGRAQAGLLQPKTAF